MKKILFITFFAISVSFAWQQSSLNYANFLMQNQDYYRAVSEYKRTAFFSRDSAETQFCYLQISKAYYKSGRFKSAVRFSGSLLNKKGLSPQIRLKSENYLGLSYYAMGLYARADDIFSKNIQKDSSGFSRLYHGMIVTETLRWQEASKIFKKIEEDADPHLSALGMELSTSVQRGQFLEYKQPALAGLLSAVLPGSGQLYSDHPVDALQAFLFVGAFAFSSYATYKYESGKKGPYLATGLALSITAIFHFGNILGAYRTAQYHNQKEQNDFVAGIREKVLGLDY